MTTPIASNMPFSPIEIKSDTQAGNTPTERSLEESTSKKLPDVELSKVLDAHQEIFPKSEDTTPKGSNFFKLIQNAFKSLSKEENMAIKIGKGTALTLGCALWGVSWILGVGCPIAGGVVGGLLGGFFGAGIGAAPSAALGMLAGVGAGAVSSLILGSLSAGLLKLGGVEESTKTIWVHTAGFPALGSMLPVLATVAAVVTIGCLAVKTTPPTPFLSYFK